MRMSHLFGRTLRDAPGDVELPSHRLMLRAALIRPLGAGIYSLLPLGWRVVRKVEQIIREELDAIGGQEMLMPVVHPADIWRESGRYEAVGPELTRFKDRGDRDMVLAMTHEEIVTDLARQEISSYRQLPMLVYHIQTKWRDEPRSRGGLIRVREFTMKDSYSLDRDEEGLDQQYRNHWRAYERIFRRMGLAFVVVGADTARRLMSSWRSRHTAKISC
jgi:prolyl-tRNA synthetase